MGSEDRPRAPHCTVHLASWRRRVRQRRRLADALLDLLLRADCELAAPECTRGSRRAAKVKNTSIGLQQAPRAAVHLAGAADARRGSLPPTAIRARVMSRCSESARLAPPSCSRRTAAWIGGDAPAPESAAPARHTRRRAAEPAPRRTARPGSAAAGVPTGGCIQPAHARQGTAPSDAGTGSVGGEAAGGQAACKGAILQRPGAALGAPNSACWRRCSWARADAGA